MSRKFKLQSVAALPSWYFSEFHRFRNIESRKKRTYKAVFVFVFWAADIFGEDSFGLHCDIGNSWDCNTFCNEIAIVSTVVHRNIIVQKSWWIEINFRFYRTQSWRDRIVSRLSLIAQMQRRIQLFGDTGFSPFTPMLHNRFLPKYLAPQKIDTFP